MWTNVQKNPSEEVTSGNAVTWCTLNSHSASLTLLGKLIHIDLFVRLQFGLKYSCKQRKIIDNNV